MIITAGYIRQSKNRKAISWPGRHRWLTFLSFVIGLLYVRTAHVATSTTTRVSSWVGCASIRHATRSDSLAYEVAQDCYAAQYGALCRFSFIAAPARMPVMASSGSQSQRSSELEMKCIETGMEENGPAQARPGVERSPWWAGRLLLLFYTFIGSFFFCDSRLLEALQWKLNVILYYHN